MMGYVVILVQKLPKNWKEFLQNRAIEKLQNVPEHLHCLLGCPMVVFRYEQFLDFLQKSQNLETKSSSEIFWAFVESFPTKKYHRAIRTKPGMEVDFYSRMLTAPQLEKRFFDDGSSTYPPVVGDFEERFTYHVYTNRSTHGSMVSWTERPSVALYAATHGVEDYDKTWHDDPEATVMVVSVEANSFFFLDETEVNQSSSHPVGRESMLIMSLPVRAIKNGGISIESFSKDQLTDKQS